MTLKEKKNLPEKVFDEMFSTITGEHPTKWIENYTKEEYPTNPVTGCPLWIENYANAAKEQWEN